MAYPSGTIVDQAVIDDLVTTCEGIATPSYFFTVEAVKAIANIDTQWQAEFPCILIGEPTITFDDGVNGRLAGEMRLVIRGCVEDRIAGYASARKLGADIRKAVLADHTRGGVALDTHVDTQELIEIPGDPQTAGPIAAVDVAVRINFRHQYDDPTIPL